MFDYQPVLTGQRITMRPMQADDWTGLFAVGSDPTVWAVHPQPERASEAGFRAYFEDQLVSGGALVVVNRADGALAGCSRFSTLYTEPEEIEIGWTFLGRLYWGGTYNFEMKRLMLGHAFQYMPQVIFRIGEHNVRSRRAVEKIGGMLADRKQHVTVDGRPSTNVYYTISKGDFLESLLGRPMQSS
jgi:RimJ/RimL family protein N-acetyltransferase